MTDGWFDRAGGYFLVDGQFGSTGKGLLAQWLANEFASSIDAVTTNAGPNSGHTAYIGDKKVVTKQLPMSAFQLVHMGYAPYVYLNGGAVIDPDTLRKEITELIFDPDALNAPCIGIHRCAAVIRPGDKQQNMDIASTGQGVGPAMARKINRVHGATAKDWRELAPYIEPYGFHHPLAHKRTLVEVSQGYSLGINQERFYPRVTSRECTVAQALADIGLPPSWHRKTIMSLRTYPIRVGNTAEGSSGSCYPDQKEITWEEVGATPELTTVTGRVRRVFTWSDIQLREAMFANAPDAVFLNFANYVSGEAINRLISRIMEASERFNAKKLDFILVGFGPKIENVKYLLAH